MLEIITNEKEIKEAEALMLNRVASIATKEGRMSLGFHGGEAKAMVYWCEPLNLWAGFEKIENRYWNSFGTDDPFLTSTINITVEMNPPLSGTNRRIAGAFAKDTSGTVYLVHRGKVGGGRKGIGKEAFMGFYTGPLRTVLDDGRYSDVIIVGELECEQFPAQLKRFVALVAKFKESAVSPVKPSSKLSTVESSDSEELVLPPVFNSEFSGSKTIPEREKIIAQCNHGIVIDALHKRVSSLIPEKLYAGNDQYRDLFIIDGDGNRVITFEAKSDTSTSSIYSAMGQLQYHQNSSNTRLVVVFPEDLREQVQHRLQSLDFEIVTFTWEEQLPAFSGLEKVIQGLC